MVDWFRERRMFNDLSQCFLCQGFTVPQSCTQLGVDIDDGLTEGLKMRTRILNNNHPPTCQWDRHSCREHQTWHYRRLSSNGVSMVASVVGNQWKVELLPFKAMWKQAFNQGGANKLWWPRNKCRLPWMMKAGTNNPRKEPEGTADVVKVWFHNDWRTPNCYWWPARCSRFGFSCSPAKYSTRAVLGYVKCNCWLSAKRPVVPSTRQLRLGWLPSLALHTTAPIQPLATAEWAQKRTDSGVATDADHGHHANEQRWLSKINISLSEDFELQNKI